MDTLSQATEESRYVVIGTNVHDTVTDRIARFLHAGAAQLGADWLNGPDATPGDYEWTDSPDAWEEYAAAYLEDHPEISAAIPDWADEVEFDAIEDEREGTEFKFTRQVGMVQMYGRGHVTAAGEVILDGNGIPDFCLPSAEITHTSATDAMTTALSLSINLQNVFALLRAEVTK